MKAPRDDSSDVAIGDDLRHVKLLQATGVLWLLLNLLMVLATLACSRNNKSVISDKPPGGEGGGTVILATGGATPSPVQNNPPPQGVLSVAEVAPSSTSTTDAASAPVSPPRPLLAAIEPKTLSTNEKVGVLRCDTFVDRYVTCITKNVPAPQQDALLRELESWVQRWKTMTATPTGTTDVGNACLTAFDRTKQAMAVYGCTWESM